MRRQHPTDPAQLARWLRTPRADQTPVEYADPMPKEPLERLYFPPAKSSWTWTDYAALVLFAVVAVMIYRGKM